MTDAERHIDRRHAWVALQFADMGKAYPCGMCSIPLALHDPCGEDFMCPLTPAQVARLAPFEPRIPLRLGSRDDTDGTYWEIECRPGRFVVEERGILGDVLAEREFALLSAAFAFVETLT